MTEPAERGTTVIGDRAVRRILERAVTEAALPGGPASALRGTAAVTGRRADVALDVRVPYPVVLEDAGDVVRRTVTERVTQLTGLTVPRTAVRIRALSERSDAAVGPASVTENDSGPVRPRRSRRTWSQRRAVAALVAFLGTTGCGALLYDLVAVHAADRAPARWRTWLVDWLSAHGPADGTVVIGGIVAALTGAWLLWLVLTPGLRNVLTMGLPQEQAIRSAVLERSAISALLRDAVSDIEGVTTVRIRVGRRRVRLRVRLGFGEPATARREVSSTATATLTDLGLTHALRPRIRLRTEPHWQRPGSGGGAPTHHTDDESLQGEIREPLA